MTNGKYARHRLVFLLVAGMLGAPPAASAFAFQSVIAQAHQASQQTYQKPETVPEKLADLNYDQYRAIQFRDSHQLWPERDFHVQFFALGYLYTHPVQINIIDDDGVHRQRFHREAFSTGDAYPHDLPPSLGFAGFRLHYEGYDPDDSIAAKNNEVMVFLGASYFRVKAAGQQYGTSARGLAIDTIAPDPEEFPVFREFWIKKPEPGTDSIVVYALMNSPSATGAYRFRVTPGSPAHVDVSATLFFRKHVHELGLAPLSSMYFYSVGSHRPPAYLRPAVHDSQGLLIADGHNRWTWRPLANPQSVRQYTFTLHNPKGFGLLQRNRDFFDYQSISMAYQARPSVWIEPKGNWGAGQVRLVEIPTHYEYYDNIVVFWTPKSPPPLHQPFHIAYRMTWGKDVVSQPVAHVQRTLFTARSLQEPTTFMIDFAGDSLAPPTAEEPTQAIVQVGDHGALLSSRTRYLESFGTYRLRFKVRPANGQPIQLRAYLTRAGQAITETWDYVLTPRINP